MKPMGPATEMATPVTAAERARRMRFPFSTFMPRAGRLPLQGSADRARGIEHQRGHAGDQDRSGHQYVLPGPAVEPSHGPEDVARTSCSRREQKQHRVIPLKNEEIAIPR